MKIAITGSRGFVGSFLSKRLIELNFDIVEIDLEVGYDITNWDSISTVENFDLLIHLAAKSYVPDSLKNPVEFYKTNILGTINALEMCRKLDVKIIFASSYVYGTPQYLPIDENHPVEAFNPYSQSKLIGEDLCRSYSRDFNVPAIILRPFNIYGKGQSSDFLVPLILNQAEKGIVKLKDSRPKRDFIYIEDVVDAFIKSIEYSASNFEIFNIGTGKSTSIAELTSLISGYFGNKLQISFSEEKRKHEVLNTIADIKKANHLLNWFPQYSLEKGIESMINN